MWRDSPRTSRPTVGNCLSKGWSTHRVSLILTPCDAWGLEERIYRMRCVEGWSMVIPWAGLPLAKLLKVVEPMGSAKYVAFETLFAPDRMPGQKTDVLEWPYIEGLRIDEAMHPLAILAMGLYGRELPPQDGAPVRLVVPWKYGFKGIKSIVKITLVDSRPKTTWNRYAPHEYGFFANVNPAVDHPRWSQATEQRIGESGRRATLPFNGYAEQVATLYTGMDLRHRLLTHPRFSIIRRYDLLAVLQVVCLDELRRAWAHAGLGRLSRSARRQLG